MSGTQRLRLVLALGVVNLVLATVALGYGLSAPVPTPDVGAVPTAGTAYASATPTAPDATSPTPPATAPAVNPTPAGPVPSEDPGEGQTPGSSVAPSPAASAQPFPVSPAPVVTPATALATQAPIAVVHNPARPASTQATPARPRATPPPPRPTPSPTKAPVAEGQGTPPACHGSERGRAASHGNACHEKAHKPKKDHHDNGRHRGAAARRPDRQADREPAIAESRAASKTRHRLRSGRRAR